MTFQRFVSGRKFIKKSHENHYELIVIGVSAGGLAALSTILPLLPAEFQIPILIVQHRRDESDSFLTNHLSKLCALPVVEGMDKLSIKPGIIIAPAGYHMLVEDKNMIALSRDTKVNFSRPSIDVLFESAATVFGSKVLGIILTGANSDGVQGAQSIKSHGGFILVQNPKTAEAQEMPTQVIKMVKVDKILDLADIGNYITHIGHRYE